MFSSALLLLPFFVPAPEAREAVETALPWEIAEPSWRTDPVWYDGLAEKCTYVATRTVYGLPRTYVATAYTNKQRMDLATTTKAAGETGLEVFKHHWSERIPTEKYDYDYSTAVFVRAKDLAPYKLTVATQDDCGASFKQLWRDGPRFSFWESVYFPGAGTAKGEIEGDGLQLADALPLVLRDFPFASSEPGASYELRLLPSQKSHRATPKETETLTLVYHGVEELDLPVGTTRAYHVTLTKELASTTPAGANFWFAAEGAAPWLHALVRYESARGDITYELRSLERTAYWKR